MGVSSTAERPATLVIRNIGELCSCDAARTPAPGVIPHAAIAARGATLTYVGDEAGVRDVAIAPDAVELDADGAAVIPGFVDAHTHMIWLGDRADEYALRAEGRSYEEIAAAGGGIRATVRATAAGDVDALTSAARPRLRRALSMGTTTVEVKSGYGLEHAAEAKQLEAAARLGAEPMLPEVVPTYLPLHALPDGERGAYVAGVIDEGLARNAPLARFADAFCDKGVFSVEECERVLAAATRCGLGVRLHADQRSPAGGARLAARLGAASADHLEHSTDDDLRALAAAAVVGVILPGAALVLGGPPPPGRRLLEAGATVAVATDCNPGTCRCESMPLMLSLAVATAGLTPALALLAATRGGAAALRLADRGMLRAGMRCDLVVLRSRRWLDVAYHLGGDVVDRVVIGGRVAASARQTDGR